MITRILTAIAILAVVIPCIIFGGPLLEALVLFIVVVGTDEYSKLTKLENYRVLTIGLILLEIIGLYLPHDLIFPYLGIVFLVLFSLPVFKEELSAYRYKSVSGKNSGCL